MRKRAPWKAAQCLTRRWFKESGICFGALTCGQSMISRWVRPCGRLGSQSSVEHLSIRKNWTESGRRGICVKLLQLLRNKCVSACGSCLRPAMRGEFCTVNLFVSRAKAGKRQASVCTTRLRAVAESDISLTLIVAPCAVTGMLLVWCVGVGETFGKFGVGNTVLLRYRKIRPRSASCFNFSHHFSLLPWQIQVNQFAHQVPTTTNSLARDPGLPCRIDTFFAFAYQ